MHAALQPFRRRPPKLLLSFDCEFVGADVSPLFDYWPIVAFRPGKNVLVREEDAWASKCAAR